MRTLIAGAAAALMTAGAAQAADKLTLQLKWVTQAQFAGYYVARDRGFFAEENLDVEIRPGGPDIAPPQVIADGGADVIVEWMPAALAARERGLPLVNIAQPFKFSGLTLTCLRSSGVTGPGDLPGRTLGVWRPDAEHLLLTWLSRLGIPTEGGPQGVAVLAQGRDVAPLLDGRADCISAMSYDEYWQVIDAGIAEADLVVFRHQDQGVAALEDGLYVLEDRLADPAFEDKLVRFVRAAMRGWRFAAENPNEAAEIVVENDASGVRTEAHQRRMMHEVARLTAGSTGALDPADFERTVDTLLGDGASPVISTRPEGAWTHAITDLAL